MSFQPTYVYCLLSTENITVYSIKKTVLKKITVSPVSPDSILVYSSTQYSSTQQYVRSSKQYQLIRLLSQYNQSSIVVLQHVVCTIQAVQKKSSTIGTALSLVHTILVLFINILYYMLKSYMMKSYSYMLKSYSYMPNSHSLYDEILFYMQGPNYYQMKEAILMVENSSN